MRIVQLDVEHLARHGEAEFDLRGKLGVESFQVQPGDDVRLRAELSAPAYAYLIAFRPDGVVEVCDPEDPAVPPTRTTQTQYPPRSKSDEVYRLEDGAGLQAFALVISKTPLPSFDDWQRRVGTPPWKAGLNGEAGVVWRHDGQWLLVGSRSDSSGHFGVAKGKTIRVQLRHCCGALADWLRAIPGIDAVEVVAFPVTQVKAADNESGREGNSCRENHGEIPSREVRSMRGKPLAPIGLFCILVVSAAWSDEPANPTVPPTTSFARALIGVRTAQHMPSNSESGAQDRMHGDPGEDRWEEAITAPKIWPHCAERVP